MTVKDSQNSAIRNIADFLTYFNADSANRANREWKDTGMNISLLNVLTTFRNQLSETSNPTLHQNFKTLKADFSKYLLEKLEGKHTAENDDLLFEVNEIVKLQLHQAVPIMLKDLENIKNPLKTELIDCLNKGNFDQARLILDQISPS